MWIQNANENVVYGIGNLAFEKCWKRVGNTFIGVCTNPELVAKLGNGADTI